MNRPFLRVHCVFFAALAMGMHLAHALELAPKLQWGPELYFPVQTSLYRWFGIVGPVLEVLALISVAALAWVSRRDRARFRYVAISLTLLVLGLVVWITVVAPAHRGLSEWLHQQITPANWMALRAQWQYGQAGIFALHLLGFYALAHAVTGDARTPPG